MGLIKRPNELTVKTTLSALIYGQPGMGKTTLALSAPNPVLFDYDGGIHRVNAAHRVPTVQITSWDETNQVLSSEEIKEFSTIVIDTAGKMYLIHVKRWSMRKFGLPEGLKTIRGRYYGLATQGNSCILSEELTV